MRKSIFVVEGQTEQIFVQKFIEKMVTLKDCRVELGSLRHGDLKIFRNNGISFDQASYCVRIINVGNDDKVNSFIDENLQNFQDKGFEIIYGLRDGYTGDKKKLPIDTDKIDKYFEPLATAKNLTLDVIIAVEEIEAWFLSVPSFFSSYDHSLTPDRVNEILNVDLSTTAVESLPHPSHLINKVLSTVRQCYKKRQADSHKIANALDYGSLYLEKTNLIPALKRFVRGIDNALA